MSSISKTTSQIALTAALLAASPFMALAQTDSGTATDPAMTAPADGATDPAAMPAETEEPAQPVEGQIMMQSENTILAEDLLGSPVYSQEGESIGDISDMIVNLDGTIEGIVIGVGGFLGIGEKSVAIEMNSLSTTTDENGNVRLVTTATQTDLEAAEEFITADQQEAASEATSAATDQGTMGTAPADTGMATDPATTGTGMATDPAATDPAATDAPAEGDAATMEEMPAEGDDAAMEEMEEPAEGEGETTTAQ